MKPGAFDKNCQNFMAKLYNSKHWQSVKEMLTVWKAQEKNIVSGIDIFKGIMRSLQANQDAEEKIIDAFNKCLVKDARLTKKIIGEYESEEDQIESTPNNEPQSFSQPNFSQRKKQEQNLPLLTRGASSRKPIVFEKIKDGDLYEKIEQHKSAEEIGRILHIYLKSIITLHQFRAILAPLYSECPSLIGTLFQFAGAIEKRRKKNTIFAPLNELIDKKYPVEQVGPSYIIIPEGYANYGENWQKNPLQKILNRKIVSVPLGSEVSFIIGKKNQFEQQLFQYEDQRYEIDNTLQSLRACQKLLTKHCKEPNLNENLLPNSRISSSLLEKVVNNLYPEQNFYNIFIRHLKLAKQILLPRIIQKRQELEEKKKNFIKVCEEVAQKNFTKSLDYRCIYFAKNDRKYNTQARWEKQIQMRKNQFLRERKGNFEEHKDSIEDRQSIIRPRNESVNSFDHITNQKFIEDQSLEFNFQRKMNTVGSSHPVYPFNQIFFTLNFGNQEVLNDALEIILSNCTKKNLLEILVYKILRIFIKRKIKKCEGLVNFLEVQQKNQFKDPNSENINQNQAKNVETLLNDYPSLREDKTHKDEEEQFREFIEEDEEAAILQKCQSPFEGPQQAETFLATKPVYIFFRYLLAIYQRFLKAKQYSSRKEDHKVSQKNQQRSNTYNLFLNSLIFKSKQKNKTQFEELLRRIYSEKAYIFFTLDKLIAGATKVINTISNDSLTYEIIKDQTRDYELGIFDWKNFPFPNISEQLTRLYQEREPLFRFTHCKEKRNVFISPWQSPFTKHYSEEAYHERKNIEKQVSLFTTKSALRRESGENKVFKSDKVEFFMGQDDIRQFSQRGELIMVRQRNQIEEKVDELVLGLKKVKKMGRIL